MSLLSESHHCHRLVQHYLSLDDSVSPYIAATQRSLLLSLQIFTQMLQQYPLDSISISYNGGKDCQLMLIIYLAALYSFIPHTTLAQMASIKAVFVNYESPFPQVTAFVESSSKQYHLDLYETTKSLRQGFEDYLESDPKIKCIIVGIRRTDPFADRLKYFDRTDHNWPDFMRVHPVLEWDLAQVWSFLLATGVEYCPLYNQGYTSLGGVDNTVPNPLLSTKNELQNELCWELEHGFEALSNHVCPGSKLCNKKCASRGNVFTTTRTTAAFYPGYYLLEDRNERDGRL